MTTQHEIAAVSEAKLLEIIAGTEGVTPGPWRYLDIGEIWHAVESDDNHTPVAVTDHGDPTGEHIANCSPEVIRSLAQMALRCYELEAERAALDAKALEAAITAAIHIDTPPHPPVPGKAARFPPTEGGSHG